MLNPAFSYPSLPPSSPSSIQALHDNEIELSRCSRAVAQEGYLVSSTEWMVPQLEEQTNETARLHCVDNMAHEHTTAHLVIEIASELGLSKHLQVRPSNLRRLHSSLRVSGHRTSPDHHFPPSHLIPL